MDRHLTYVAMTRHRDEVQLYAGLDEFKSMQSLTNTLSRSGAKETTLDYTRAFADRRGLDLPETKVELELASTSADGEAPAIRSDFPATAALGPLGKNDLVDRHGDHRRPVLIPAVVEYEKTVEEVARARAVHVFDQNWKKVEEFAPQVFKDARAVLGELRATILDRNEEFARLVGQLQSAPETLGTLVGKTGLFGDNAVRRGARKLAGALAAHVKSSEKTWQWRLDEERKSEAWKRENVDPIEIPDLSKQSEALLRNLKDLWIEGERRDICKLIATPEYRQALDEAKKITKAFERRFGFANPANLTTEQLERIGLGQVHNTERVKELTGLAYIGHRVELAQELELKRSLTRSQGLGYRI